MTRKILATSILFVALLFGSLAWASPPTNLSKPPTDFGKSDVVIYKHRTVDTFKEPYKAPAIVFSHGDISWLPELAAKAGWAPKHIPRLAHIILRESGACPARRGGDIVNKACVVIGHDGSNHASDSGLLQINGINYNPKRNKYAPICNQMKICTQEPLLDALTNLKAGLLLFKATGSNWSPWIVPEGGW